MFLQATNCCKWRQVGVSERRRGTYIGRTGRSWGAEGIGFNADSMVNPFAVVNSIIVRIIDNRL